MYQKFYTHYDPKSADRLGIIYTPIEIIQFILSGADHLLSKYFDTNIHNPNINVLDPCTGTGTFMAELLKYLSPERLSIKYKNALFANELSFSAYFIACLVIEYTYFILTNIYKPFTNLALMDTLDNSSPLNKEKIQQKLFIDNSIESRPTVQMQNTKKMHIILGNPPYNTGQNNYNEFNANRKYEQIDERIQNTFRKESTAQKINLEDIYIRFFRYAMDRLDKKQGGIIAFITNNAYTYGIGFSGFRRVINKEFDYIYIVDLGGNIRKKIGVDGLSGTIHNVFGVMVGVCITFLIKLPADKPPASQMFYHAVPEVWIKEKKLSFLQQHHLSKLPFKKIFPDKHLHWFNHTHNDWDTLIPVCTKYSKYSKAPHEINAIFKYYHLGVSTGRDKWLIDKNKDNLAKKVSHFISIYNASVNDPTFADKYTIQWGRELEDCADRRVLFTFEKELIAETMYKPYLKIYFYCEDKLAQRTYSVRRVFGSKGDKSNTAIAFSGICHKKEFSCLAVKNIINGDCLETSQTLPFYIYTNNGANERIENITNWGLKQFILHYKNEAITKRNIFHYVYAVLHNPEYKKKYKYNLSRTFPHIPFYKDFYKWVSLGKQLMHLHLNYENIDPYPLKMHTTDAPVTNLKGKVVGDTLVLDSATTFYSIPKEAYEYTIGSKSILKHLLTNFKRRKLSSDTYPSRFDIYEYNDHKNYVILHFRKLCRVSIETVNLLNTI